MIIERIEEYQLTKNTHQTIYSLLLEGFGQYPAGRDFFRQLPTFRLLAWSDQQDLIGHMAVEHRLVNNQGQLLRIFGIADFTVATSHRNQGIGTNLLQALTDLGHTSEVDFLLLLAHDSGTVYARQGFIAIDAQCKWLLIQQDQSLGVLNRFIAGSLMIKPISNVSWKEGNLDFLGHIF